MGILFGVGLGFIFFITAFIALIIKLMRSDYPSSIFWFGYILISLSYGLLRSITHSTSLSLTDHLLSGFSFPFFGVLIGDSESLIFLFIIILMYIQLKSHRK